ncbi:MAG: type-F conjugative transfer system pilin assembly protein TrbC [Legionellales bacterium RIFCSPHIGHO2_12_FULL_42_9]|nr:MAG: type-F conjugative transfer system pilin assembly protein TrbC [Legionellales bacterium RIFCSPHIGHO2_12_FULL_42_9]
MRIFMILIGLCLSFVSMANTYVFVSFSMPETLMIETLQECERLHIPAILNGLYQNSMPETAKKVMALSNQIPNLSLQIDPTAFERFNIHQVPALVVEQGDCFDVIYGTLPLVEELDRIQRRGECKDGVQ